MARYPTISFSTHHLHPPVTSSPVEAPLGDSMPLVPNTILRVNTLAALPLVNYSHSLSLCRARLHPTVRSWISPAGSLASVNHLFGLRWLFLTQCQVWASSFLSGTCLLYLFCAVALLFFGCSSAHSLSLCVSGSR